MTENTYEFYKVSGSTGIDHVLGLAQKFHGECIRPGEVYSTYRMAKHIESLLMRDDAIVILGMNGHTPVCFATACSVYIFAEKPFGEIGEFYVSPEHRGTGCARLLRDVVENWFDEKGCGTRCAAVSSNLISGEKNNILFRNLFYKNGYVQTGYDMTRFIVSPNN